MLFLNLKIKVIQYKHFNKINKKKYIIDYIYINNIINLRFFNFIKWQIMLQERKDLKI